MSIQKFHRLVAAHSLTPVAEVPGIRGAKFWTPSDVDQLADVLATQATAAASAS